MSTGDAAFIKALNSDCLSEQPFGLFLSVKQSRTGEELQGLIQQEMQFKHLVFLKYCTLNKGNQTWKLNTRGTKSDCA